MATHSDDVFCDSIRNSNPSLLEDEERYTIERVVDIQTYYKTNIDHHECLRCDYIALLNYVKEYMERIQSENIINHRKVILMTSGLVISLNQFHTIDIIVLDFMKLLAPLIQIVKDVRTKLESYEDTLAVPLMTAVHRLQNELEKQLDIMERRKPTKYIQKYSLDSEPFKGVVPRTLNFCGSQICS